MTGHRSQGSGWKNVLVVLDYCAYKLLNRQWVYTAMTRTIKYCVVIAEYRALTHAINTDECDLN
ncbi:ATP-binding domain-containing protein [Brevibacillus daliensis]|uniref:ATP-binding domain-containing protein n=1 Tax=Brevibacillus daliensis TaxID=2892995 RepID=UPI0035A1162C